jgi:hypothetical protein
VPRRPRARVLFRRGMAAQQQQAKKRPWYLVAALLGALALGLSGGYSGCATWAIYHGEIPRSDIVAGFTSDTDRDAVGAAWDRLVAAYDAAAPHEYPMGIALLLVSAALVLFAMRGMAGRGSARNILMQLVIVQAVLYVVEYFLTTGIRAADLDLYAAKQIAVTHDPEVEQLMALVKRAPWLLSFGLIVRTFASALIVFALTRQRSREFFEATTDPAVEQ